MSSNILSLIDVGFQIPAALIVIFTCYRSFRLRDGLVNEIYRTRALWVGVLGIFFVLAEILQIGSDLGYAPFYFPPYPNTSILVAYTVFTAFGVGALYGWFDTTARVVLDMDFFHRDPLHWKSIRKPAWALLIMGVVVTDLTPNFFYYSVVSIIFFAPVFVLPGLVIVLSEKSLYDGALRRYVKWIGILIATLFLLFATSAINPFLNFPLLLTAYCLYMVSVSLSSTSKVELAPPGTPRT